MSFPENKPKDCSFCYNTFDNYRSDSRIFYDCTICNFIVEYKDLSAFAEIFDPNQMALVSEALIIQGGEGRRIYIDSYYELYRFKDNDVEFYNIGLYEIDVSIGPDNANKLWLKYYKLANLS